MKTASTFSLVAAFALAPLLAGCAAEDEDLNAQYPGGAAAGTIGSSDQDIQGIAPGAAVNSAQAQAAADDAYARGYAAAQAGEPPPNQANTAGANGGDVTVIGGDDSQYADTDPSALTDFRTTLDPYGTWVDDPNYGTIWVPSSSVVGADFTPYVSAGHWVYDDDYVWVSDYEWGWAPFHYGRWIQTGRGWGWIPGRRYGGAWVSWRTGYDGWGYIGWAPLGPSWYWRGGYAYGLYSVPPAPYAYCPNGRIFSPTISGVVIRGSNAGEVAAHTRPYVSATPSVNGRVAATPSVNQRGPAPAGLGLNSSQVPHSTSSNIGIARAQGFAHPESAQAFGAHAPAGSNTSRYGAVPRETLPARSTLAPIATGPRYLGSTGGTGPSRVAYPSHSFSSPSYASPAYSRPSSSFEGHSFSGASSGFTPHSSFSSSPSFHSGGSSFASPSFHAAAPAYHPSSHTSFSGGGHAGGGHGRR